MSKVKAKKCYVRVRIYPVLRKYCYKDNVGVTEFPYGHCRKYHLGLRECTLFHREIPKKYFEENGSVRRPKFCKDAEIEEP